MAKPERNVSGELLALPFFSIDAVNVNGRSRSAFTFAFKRAGSALERRRERPERPTGGVTRARAAPSVWHRVAPKSWF